MKATFRVGDTFYVGGEKYILALEDDWKDCRIEHFQLINSRTGNRYSDKVITHDRDVFSDLSLTNDEIEYLIDEDDDKITKAIKRSRKKGPAWE